MKTKEYFRLAKISLKSRKKTTRSTITGIVFGLILLLPIIFLGLGINGDLKAKINKSPELLYSVAPMAKASSGYVDTPYNYANNDTSKYTNMIIGDHTDFIRNLDATSISYEMFYNPSLDSNNSYGNNESEDMLSTYTKYAIGDGEYQLITKKARSYEQYSTPKSTGKLSMIEPSDFAKLNSIYKGVFREGYDAGFTGNGKGQVMISEGLLATMNLTADQVYNKEFSIYYRDFAYVLDNDSDPNNECTSYIEYKDQTLFKKYKVVGVVKAEYAEGLGEKHVLNGDMIVTPSSLYNSKGELAINYVENKKSGDKYATIYTYTQSEEDLARLSEEYVYTGIQSFSNKIGGTLNGESIRYPQTFMAVYGRDYAHLNSINQSIAGDMKVALGDNAVDVFNSTCASETFSMFNTIFTIFSYLLIVLLSIGGIIFFSAMVNLFNTIMHSVDTRHNYLGVMRAIGAKKSVIPKLYIFETLTIFLRSMIWILLLGGGICVGIKVAIDMLFDYTGAVGGIILSIGWEYIAISFGIVIGVLVGLGLLFSYICSRKVASKPITEVLEG